MEAITEAEKQRRHRVADSIIGTHAMEGLHLDAQTRRILDRYSEGELTLEEFSAAMQSYAKELAARVSERRLAGAA